MISPPSAHVVAAELRRRVPGLGVKKLHKLLYYCQGHHLGSLGEPLFREPVSAWDMGPVVGSLWFEERQGLRAEAERLAEAQLNTIGYVVSRYGALSGADLERLTHSEAPWQDADRARRPGASAKISTDALASYFQDAQWDDDEQETLLPDSEVLSRWLKETTDVRDVARKPDSLEELRRRLAANAL